MRKFEVKESGSEDFSGEYLGFDCYDAAESYATDANDEGQLFKSEQIIEIREIGTEKIKKIAIGAYADTVYTSRDVKEDA